MKRMAGIPDKVGLWMVRSQLHERPPGTFNCITRHGIGWSSVPEADDLWCSGGGGGILLPPFL